MATTQFELVSPERLLLSEQVEMVVVPGTEGNFGVLPGHAPLISTVRPGVIDVYRTRPEISARIFVAGGFAEVTPERCTVLAEEAVPVGDLDAATVDGEIADLGEDLADAKTEAERKRVGEALAVARAKREAVGR
jgi:F-type H+-transporting ATPase subunit epsilon